MRDSGEDRNTVDPEMMQRSKGQEKIRCELGDLDKHKDAYEDTFDPWTSFSVSISSY